MKLTIKVTTNFITNTFTLTKATKTTLLKKKWTHNNSEGIFVIIVFD